MENTAYSITTVLRSFMGGLVLASFLAGRFIDRRSDPIRVFTFMEGKIAVYCFVLPWLIQSVEPLSRSFSRTPTPPWNHIGGDPVQLQQTANAAFMKPPC